MRTAGVARPAAVLGVLMALGVSVTLQGVQGSGGRIEWPALLSSLGASPFRSDALSAGLGAWCLLIGALCLLKIGSGENTPAQLATGMLAIATLFTLVHTSNLLAFGVLVFFLALLAWAFFLVSGEQDARTDRSTLSLGLGSLFLVGVALLTGRQTGGDYDLSNISISTFTVWPLVLVAAFVIAWLGMLPLTGWSALVPSGGFGTMAHSLLLGVPVFTLMLRLQALVTEQAFGVTIPASWSAFMQAFMWLGGVTCVVAAAGMVAWAGKSRWPALQVTFWLGLVLWALGLDTPLARYAALAMLLAYGAGRVALTLLPSGDTSRATTFLTMFANASLAGAPLTPGFMGVWLLGHALVEESHPSLALVVAGAAVLAACGTALHAGSRSLRGSDLAGNYMRWAGILCGCLLVAVTLLLPLWSPYLEGVVAVAGGSSHMNSNWVGLSSGSGVLPVTLLLGGTILFAGSGWLLLTAARSSSGIAGVLLPTALERLDKGANGMESEQASPDMSAILENSPSPVWWLSMAWLDRGVWGFGSLLGRLTARFGGLLGRLEGRFYLPLAIIMTLVALLVVSR